MSGAGATRHFGFISGNAQEVLIQQSAIRREIANYALPLTGIKVETLAANKLMYQDAVRTGAEALTHLFFHCCLKDGEYTRTELNTLSDKIVATGLDKHLNFKEEMQRYKSYYPSITSDEAYIAYLVDLIKPVNELALYSYCIELCISDSVFAAEEEQLLIRIGNAFGIDATVQQTCRTLMIQRNVIETHKLY